MSNKALDRFVYSLRCILREYGDSQAAEERITDLLVNWNGATVVAGLSHAHITVAIAALIDMQVAKLAEEGPQTAEGARLYFAAAARQAGTRRRPSSAAPAERLH